ncbi:N-glycosylase/DNA lyase [Candidatus Pacearchaeota archaeon]|nr:N-glycosylase/DNA lyase [Candidatus Pacearchaeota archaeon]
MNKELLELYQQKKSEIQNRLSQFKNLQEENYFKEFLFCLLTPQSNAQKCWQAVEIINKSNSQDENKIFNILKTKTRFHKTKTSRIVEAFQTWNEIKTKLAEKNIPELRNWLAENINGYGLKEASHFLRNIGKSDNQIAILDRHILKNLKNLNVIENDKIKNKKNYFEIEAKFIEYSKNIGIPIDEIDLLWWSKENGKIFK